jgi:hypothetical protein
MSNQIYSDLFEALKQYRGSISVVADRRGCTGQWVRDVLRGKYKDIELTEIAVQVLQEYRDREQDIEKKAHQALKS